MTPATAATSFHRAVAGGGALARAAAASVGSAVGNQALQRLVGPAAAVPPRAPALPAWKLGGAKAARPAAAPPRSVVIAYPGAPIVQRLMKPDVFKAATYGTRMSVRGGTLKEIDQWLAQYHELPAPPENAGQRDTMVSVIEEVEEAAAAWQEGHANDTSEATAIRLPAVRNLVSEAAAEKAKLARITFPEGQQAVVTAADDKTKKVQDKLTGDFKQASERLGVLVDLAVAGKGTTAEFEFELSIPIPGSGAEMGFHLTLEAERDDKNDVELGMELGVTAGGSVGVAKLQGELGGFTEAKAGSGAEVMKLVSYVLYQKFRESSVLPREIANYMWGGTMSRQGYKLAERWAAKVEKDVLAKGTEDRERFVRRGMYGAFKAEGGVTGGKLGGSVKGRRFKEYTKATLEQQTGGKKLDELSVKELAQMRMPTKRGARESLGATKHEGILGFEAEFGPFSGSLEYTIGSEERELEISAAAMFNLVELGGGGAAGALVAYIGNMATRLSPMISEKTGGNSEEEDALAALDSANLVGDFAATVAALNAAVKSDPKIEFETFDPDKPGETAAESSVGIEAAVTLTEAGGKLKEWEVKLIAKQKRGIETPVLTAALEQGKVIKKWPA